MTHEINKEPKFKIGDIVQLKSGSFPMTVNSISEPCKYSDRFTIWTKYQSNSNKKIEMESFDQDALILTEIKKPWWAR